MSYENSARVLKLLAGNTPPLRRAEPITAIAYEGAQTDRPGNPIGKLWHPLFV